MIRKSVLITGFLALTAAIGTEPTSVTLADDGQRIYFNERIGHGGSTYSRATLDGDSDHNLIRDKGSPVDAIERIGHGGSLYSFIGPTPVEKRERSAGNKQATVMERIGHGGSTYFTGETLMN